MPREMSAASPGWSAATDRTWVDVFVDQTERHAKRVFVRCGDDVLTYGGLRDEVDRLAWGLLKDGVRPGQTLAVWMHNCIDFLIAQWATYRTGCSLLPLYSYYRAPELEHGLRDASATTLLTRAELAGQVDARSLLAELLPELTYPGAQEFARTPALRRVLTCEAWGLPGTRTIGSVTATGGAPDLQALERIRERLSPFDVVNIMYTSGTTGIPKGGLSMHRNNMATVHLWREAADLDADDILLCHVPLFTNFGCLYASGLALYTGASIVLTERFDAEQSLRLIERERVTYIPGTPEMFRMLLEHERFAETDVSSVRSGHIAGSALEPALMERIIDELAPDALQAYGMSECGGLSTASTASDPRQARVETVGKPLASSVVEVRDPETGARLPDGTTGEIWFGDAEPGSCVGKGYLGDGDATAEAITPEGWFRTGDLGFYDGEGYLRFTGRRKNMITVGGFNVYPQEVEHVLKGLAGVRDAYVVGVADRRLGSVPVAFVLLEGDETDLDALRVAVADRLSSQKRPRALWPLGDDDVPYTPSGKVRRVDLEAMAQQRWSISEDR